MYCRLFAASTANGYALPHPTFGESDEIKVSMAYLGYKAKARERLRSEEGRALSVRRMVEVESVFGQMKNNRGFRRFLLRGLPKVSLEVGWLSLAHNLLKRAAIGQKVKTVGQE